MSAIIQERLQHDSSSRPYASQVSRLISEHLDKLTSSNPCGSDTPTTAVLECNTECNPVSMADSVGINDSICSIVNHGNHNGSCDTATVSNTDADTLKLSYSINARCFRL